MNYRGSGVPHPSIDLNGQYDISQGEKQSRAARPGQGVCAAGGGPSTHSHGPRTAPRATLPDGTLGGDRGRCLVRVTGYDDMRSRGAGMYIGDKGHPWHRDVHNHKMRTGRAFTEMVLVPVALH